MARSFLAIYLLNFIVKDYAKELTTNPTVDLRSSVAKDSAVSKVSTNVIDKLSHRAHKAFLRRDAKLDSTTLAKNEPEAAQEQKPESQKPEARVLVTRVESQKVENNVESPAMEGGLVSCEWLAEHLQSPKLRVVDATWFLPSGEFACPVEGSTAEGEFQKGPRIPGASFLDLDAIADKTTALPHMLPKAETLAGALARLGITKEHSVVVYDQLGLFSAPRLWYTLKAFGHPNVAVLDGGLPLWLKKGLRVETGTVKLPTPVPEDNLKVSPEMVWNWQQIVENIDSRKAVLIDARPKDRWTGTAPEPRVGMRSGRVPGSKNIPFTSLLHTNATMKDCKELADTFANAGISLEHPSPVVSSCGSGLTACIIGLGLKQCGFPVETHWAVYDGSWAEYGSLHDAPVVKESRNGDLDFSFVPPSVKSPSVATAAVPQKVARPYHASAHPVFGTVLPARGHFAQLR